MCPIIALLKQTHTKGSRRRDCLQLEEDEVEYEKEQVRQAALHRLAWEADVQEKHRLQKMQAAKDKLAQDIMGRRAAEFARLKVSPRLAHASPPVLLLAVRIISPMTASSSSQHLIPYSRRCISAQQSASRA